MDFINQDKFIIARGVEVRNTADYFIAQAAVGTLSRSHRFYPPPVSRSSPALPSATPFSNIPPEKAIPNPDNPSTLRAQDTDVLIKFLLLSLDQPPAV